MIEISSLSFGYAGRPVFDGIDLRVQERQVLGVLGPSGVGKSTLLRLLAGLIEPSLGEIKVGGVSPREALESSALGFMFQKDMLLDWLTASENIALAFERRPCSSQQRDRTINDLLSRVGLAGAGGKFPHELSGGMRQRVALCRGLATNPKVMLLDEPFSSVDMLSREEIMIWLRGLLGGHQTSVLVTHHVEEAVYLCDEVVVLAGLPAKIVFRLQTDIDRESPDVMVSERFLKAAAQLRAALRMGRQS